MSQDKPKEVLVTEQPSTGSLSVFASVGPEREPMPYTQDPSILDWMEVKTKWWFWFLKRRRYSCGHIGPRAYRIRIWGMEFKPTHKVRCPDCDLKKIQEVAIRCCLCGFPILPGDGVALYDADSIAEKNYPIKLLGNSLAIGCMRWNCCPSGGFFSGYWNGEDLDPL